MGAKQSAGTAPWNRYTADGLDSLSLELDQLNLSLPLLLPFWAEAVLLIPSGRPPALARVARKIALFSTEDTVRLLTIPALNKLGAMLGELRQALAAGAPTDLAPLDDDVQTIVPVSTPGDEECPVGAHGGAPCCLGMALAPPAH